jgi:hypothetical protein
MVCGDEVVGRWRRDDCRAECERGTVRQTISVGRGWARRSSAVGSRAWAGGRFGFRDSGRSRSCRLPPRCVAGGAPLRYGSRGPRRHRACWTGSLDSLCRAVTWLSAFFARQASRLLGFGPKAHCRVIYDWTSCETSSCILYSMYYWIR